jgi:hypothetical protein
MFVQLEKQNEKKKKIEKSEKNIACYELQQSQTDDVRLRHFSNKKIRIFPDFGKLFKVRWWQ